MGTNATLVVQLADGNYKVSSVNYDGYPSYALRMLREHYNDYDKAVELINLGALSILAESIECPEGHCFNTPVDGHTIAYGRDRGEDWHLVKPRILSFLPKKIGTDYRYVFKDGEWAIG